MNTQERLNSAIRAHKEGRYADAESHYLAVLEQGQKIVPVLNALVDLSQAANDHNKVATYLERLCVLLPKELYYCDRLSNLFADAGLWDLASNCYARFVEHNPGLPNAYYNYAFNLKQAGRYREALVQYQNALDHRIDQAEEVLINMAVICSGDLREDQRAIELLMLALEQKPNYIPALYNLASLYEESGDKHNAARYFGKVVELAPDNIQATARLAELTSYSDPHHPIIQTLVDKFEQGELDAETKINAGYALGKVFNDCSDYDRAFHYYSQANKLDSSTGLPYNRAEQESLVDENLRFFSKKWFENLKSISTESPIFICGMFRSGSTLVEQILASHPEVTAGGERNFFFNTIKGDLRPYPTSLSRVTSQQFASIADQYLNEMKTAFSYTNFVTDKRPDNIWYIGLIKSIFPNAKIIITERDPLDNCLSVFFLRLAPIMSYANCLSDIAHHYQQQHRLAEHWKSIFPESVYQIGYDDLVSSPASNIGNLLEFLGLDWSDECLNFHQLKNRVKTASVWQVRQPLYTSSSGRWRNYSQYIEPLREQLMNDLNKESSA